MNIIHHEKGRDPLYKIWNYSTTNMILYTYSDGGTVVFRDRIYPIEKGMLCFIGSCKQHYTMPDNPEIYDRSKIYLSDEVLKGILDLFPNDSAFQSLFRDNSVVYAKIPEADMAAVEKIYSEALDRTPEVFICSFFRLMGYLNKYKSQQMTAADNFMVRAVKHINSNYAWKLSLEDLCAEMHMSKYYFCRKFKDSMGITVMEYILKTRLAAAKDMLSSSDIAVGEISENCGFSSVSYFCQVFKRSTGMTPSEYRENSQLKI